MKMRHKPLLFCFIILSPHQYQAFLFQKKINLRSAWNLKTKCCLHNGNKFNDADHAPKERRKRSNRRKGDPHLIRAKSLAKGRDPIISLNMNLDYLAKSGQRGAAHRAEELLLRIEHLYNEGYYDSRPGKFLGVPMVYLLSMPNSKRIF